MSESDDDSDDWATGEDLPDIKAVAIGGGHQEDETLILDKADDDDDDAAWEQKMLPAPKQGTESADDKGGEPMIIVDMTMLSSEKIHSKFDQNSVNDPDAARVLRKQLEQSYDKYAKDAELHADGTIVPCVTSCYESTLTRHLREQIEDVRVCFTDEEGNEACLTKSFFQLIFELADDLASFNLFHNSFECTADVNGQACASCTPCGVTTTGPLPVGEDFDFVIDCSNIEAGSVWNGCDQTATGLWEFVYEADASLSCPGGTAPTTESPTVSPRRGSPSQNDGDVGGSDTANVGLIFGIVGALAGVLLLIGIGAGVYCCLQKNKDQDAQTHVYPGAIPAGAATETATPTSTSVEPEYSYAVDL